MPMEPLNTREEEWNGRIRGDSAGGLKALKNFGFHANEWVFKGETAQMEEIGGGDHGGVV
jgi:hypothetical protein